VTKEKQSYAGTCSKILQVAAYIFNSWSKYLLTHVTCNSHILL
jgi:hypothetical protein